MATATELIPNELRTQPLWVPYSLVKDPKKKKARKVPHKKWGSREDNYDRSHLRPLDDLLSAPGEPTLADLGEKQGQYYKCPGPCKKWHLTANEVDGKLVIHCKTPSCPKGAAWKALQPASHRPRDGYQRLIDRSEGYVYIDLDKAIDENGEVKPWAKAIVDLLNSYTEISGSGTGLHIVCRGTLPGDHDQTPVEIYSGHINKLMALTGNVHEMHRTIENRQEQLEQLYRDAKAALPPRDVLRADFTWDDLLTESEIINQQGLELIYAIDKLVPKQRITMLFGKEKSGKSLVAFYMAKCVANGRKVFDNFAVEVMPCLYLDGEDGILGEYIGWMQGIGAEQVRFRTLLTGIPALDSDALLEICRTRKPLLIIDSLHKFTGGDKTNSWASSDMEPVLEKIRQLCVTGATVILIHHSTKADPEQYRDSSAIGAGVDFIFAIISDGAINGVTRVRMVGLPSRGAQPPTLNLIAFPALIDLGKFTLDDKPPQTDVDRVVEYVENHKQTNRAGIQKELKGMSNARKTKAVNEGVKKGRLVEDKLGCLRVGKSHSQSGDDTISFFDHPEAGMSGDDTEREPQF